MRDQRTGTSLVTDTALQGKQKEKNTGILYRKETDRQRNAKGEPEQESKGEDEKGKEDVEDSLEIIRRENK